MRPQPGDLINGKYRLIRLIGDGGMGSVFEARHEYLSTVVALKFLHAELASRQGLVARFLREARLSASIKSDHIARVTDVDQAGEGAAYLVMELLEGQSLREVLEREGRLPPRLAIDYTLQMLDGLEAAHAVGVVHRDLKPDNVFVVNTPKGPLIKLLDFGIAKLRSAKELQGSLTRPGVLMGTPEYMAPEQAYAADSVDGRADVYSVGAMLYEMLAGTRPAQGEDPLEIAAFIMAQKVPRLSQVDRTIPDRLADVVHKAMAPMPTDRFTSVGELRSSLLPFSGQRGAGVTPVSEGVPATLPPDAIVEQRRAAPPPYAPGPKTEATGEVPRAVPAFTPAYALPPPPARVPPVQNFPAPGGYPNLPPVPTTQNRGPRRFAAWLLIAMCVIAVGIVAIALAMGELNEPEKRADGSTATTPTVAPAQTPSPPSTGAVPTVVAPIGAPVQPPVGPAPTHTTTTPTKTPPKTSTDGGTHSEDAGSPAIPTIPGLPGFPFPIPSSLPIPSTLPIPIGLPSTFPPFNMPGFPGVPVPGAPASSH